MLAPPWPVQAEEHPDDRRAVEQCLALTVINRTTDGNTRAVDLPQKQTTAEARLKAAASAAPQKPESCIGIVSQSCTGPENAASDGGQIACLNRELDVWDTRLNEAYRRVISRADPDARLRFVKVQRAWLAWRDASCAQLNVVYQGSIAEPMQANCLVQATARQSIWLESWN